MQSYVKLKRYPLGAIAAEGFIKEQMLRSKDGIAGHLYELEPGMIADPFINKSYVKAWGNGDQSGWGAEISGNYWTGYIQFAFTLGDEEMIQKATDWVDTMMKKQREDGYLGTYYEPDALIYEDYNAWGTACAMRGLLAFYEVTGRKDVLEAVYRCMLWFCDVWAGDKKTSYAGPFIVEPMIQTYFLTGDERLRQFAVDYTEYLTEHDIFKLSYKSMLSDEYHYNSNHTAGMGNALRLPAIVYAATGNKEYLDASVKRIGMVVDRSVNLTGGPTGIAEYLAPIGSTMETEYCSFAFYNATYSSMSCITGDPLYGDLMEQMFYNGAQGARKKDEKAIAYFSAPNQTYATTMSSCSYGDLQVYAPCYPTSCCPVNAVVVLPEFVRGMLLTDDAENVYVMAYGPCTLKNNDVALRFETLYPFRNNVKICVDCDKSFALNLKIPAWAKGYTITINGEKTEAACKDGFATVECDWKNGDCVEITFDTAVEIIKVDDSDAAGKHPIAIRYGALVYAYHVPEKWVPITGRPMTELPEGWTWYNVAPVYKDVDVYDAHERIGLRRNQFTWNVALDENLKPEDVEIELLPVEGYVWENPPIRLHTHCYKAPFMTAPYPCRYVETNEPYQYVTDKLDLTLVPHGCTNLRITYFPKADLKNKK